MGSSVAIAEGQTTLENFSGDITVPPGLREASRGGSGSFELNFGNFTQVFNSNLAAVGGVSSVSSAYSTTTVPLSNGQTLTLEETQPIPGPPFILDALSSGQTGQIAAATEPPATSDWEGVAPLSATAAATAGGGFVAAWNNMLFTSVNQNTPASQFVTVADYSATGNLLWSNNYGGPINAFGSTPALTVLPNGNIIMAGDGTFGSSSDVVVWTIPSSGSPATSFTGGPISGNPAVASLANGDFVATWYDGTHIEEQLFSSSGTPIGTTNQVNTAGNATSASSPVVSALNNGDYVTIWSAQTGGTGPSGLQNSKLFGQLYNSSGDVIGTQFSFGAANAEVNEVAATPLANGSFEVSWLQQATGPSTVPALSLQGEVFSPAGVTDDFTGQGISDILWQNGGTVIDWIMQNGQLQSSNLLPKAASGWQAVGTGDFTGNGTADILWQNGGAVIDWMMQNGQFQSSNLLDSNVGAGWQAVGTGDFTGNGPADILWQNGGAVIDWVMKNGQLQSSNLLDPNVGAGWQVAGTGDFTGNGTDDILWQNGGAVIDWIMQNGQLQSSNLLDPNVGAGWHMVGTGDFTGNGTDDILWQNGSTVIDWVMKNGQFQTSNLLSNNVGAGWQAVGTGDFTGNGTDDILWQNGGTVIDWIMKNGQLQSSNLLDPNVGAGWQVVPAHA